MILRYAYLVWLRHRLRRFLDDARRARAIQHRVLLRKIRRHQDSNFGRDYGLAELNSVDAYRRRMPVLTYEQHRPYISRVLQGETTALFAPGTRVLMFAMTSGTTGEPKRLPITTDLFREYRAGWRLWGAGVYGDHRRLLLTKTLQLTSDWQRYCAPCGIPCGQISGLAASSRPKVASTIFLLPPITGRIHDPATKHYTALRLSLSSDRVGMIVTANPSTLVEFARRADQQREALVRDIHDGTLSCELPAEVREALTRRISRRNPRRARELERLAEHHGALLPKHAWPNLSVIAVWTGGSVGMFLPKVTELFGSVAVRDHGLSASEGRMTIPLNDGSRAGILDYCHHYFEFIPVEEQDSRQPTILEGHELAEGRDYFILMTTSGGLYRYNIQDVVRCVGFEGQAPLLEFMNKGKSFSNFVGEKLSEHQVVAAVQRSFRELGLSIDTFTLAPAMDHMPRYVLLIEPHVHQGRTSELARSVQANLERMNEEYAEKSASGRLLPLRLGILPAGTWDQLRQQKTGPRGNFEEYKHPCLVSDPGFAARFSPRFPDSSAHVAKVS
jgi:hypothetical protein